MSAKSPWVYGVSSLLLVVECGGKTSTLPPLTQSEFIEQYCASVAECCGAEFLSNDPKNCVALLSAFAGTFDATSSQTCLDDISKKQSDPSWCVAYADPPRCVGALAALRGEKGRGTAKIGDACNVASDCAPVGENAYVICEAGGALSGPTLHECTQENVIPAGAQTTCMGDKETDPVGWVIFDSAIFGSSSSVCQGSSALECVGGTACRDRLTEGFVAPGGPCDYEHACVYGDCPNSGVAICPTHSTTDEGLVTLCGRP